MTTYNDLCAQYYDLDKPDAPAEAFSFYLEYVKNANGPVLEPMCGTGRFLIPMLEQGFDVEGTDFSSHMLNICKEKCHARNLHPVLYKIPLHEMGLHKKYSLIFIPEGSFGLITDTVEAKKCLEILCSHISSGGKLVFEIETINAVSDILDGSQQRVVHNKDDGSSISLKMSPAWNKNTQVLHTICQYDVILDSRVIKTEIEDFRVRYYRNNEMDRLLKEAGFQKILKYGYYDRSPVNNDTKTISYECAINSQVNCEE